MQIELSESERSLLWALLQDYIGETKSEIRHTMTTPYKDMLKGKATEAKELLRKLSPAEAAA